MNYCSDLRVRQGPVRPRWLSPLTLHRLQATSNRAGVSWAGSLNSHRSLAKLRIGFRLTSS
jgi:hypothetical protein